MPGNLDTNFWLNLLQNQGVAMFLVLWFVLFITFRVWPWWTGVYIPMRAKKEDELQSTLVTLTNAVIEMKGLTTAVSHRTEYVEEIARNTFTFVQNHDMWERMWRESAEGVKYTRKRAEAAATAKVTAPKKAKKEKAA